jgi:hypothetical protein
VATNKSRDFRNVGRIGQESWLTFHRVFPIFPLVRLKETKVVVRRVRRRRGGGGGLIAFRGDNGLRERLSGSSKCARSKGCKGGKEQEGDEAHGWSVE